MYALVHSTCRHVSSLDYCKVKGLRSCRNLEQLWKILNCLVKFEVFQNFGPKIRWQYWFFRLINVNLLFLPQEIYRVPIWFHPLPILSNCYRKIDKKLLFAHKIRSCHKELTSFWLCYFLLYGLPFMLELKFWIF